MKTMSIFALFGVILFLPLALIAMVRSSAKRVTNKRYDTSDYVSEEPL